MTALDRLEKAVERIAEGLKGRWLKPCTRCQSEGYDHDGEDNGVQPPGRWSGSDPYSGLELEAILADLRKERGEAVATVGSVTESFLVDGDRYQRISIQTKGPGVERGQSLYATPPATVPREHICRRCGGECDV